MRIGFLVNPIAGMGGSVGLKGTDGENVQAEAVTRGAVKVSPSRSREAIRGLRAEELGLEFLTCAGEMGKEELDSEGIQSSVVYEPQNETTSEDTRRAVTEFMKRKINLILFAGGDGTARDVVDIADRTVPILGIPSGVKMFSGVFAYRPSDVAELLQVFAHTRAVTEVDVVDIDEDRFRAGVLSTRLHGVALVPAVKECVQSGKTEYSSGDDSDEADEIAEYVTEGMKSGTVYIIGPGSTTEKIVNKLGEEKTLLGVDAVLDGTVVCRDASEQNLLELLGAGVEARIIVTPIGAQGVFFGRGNQQVSPKVIRRVGIDRVIVVATPTKLASTPVLRTDTGDGSLDNAFRGTIKVVTGYKRRKIVPVK